MMGKEKRPKSEKYSEFLFCLLNLWFFLFSYSLCCHRGCSNSLMVVPGVSIKIEVATGLDRVTDCTNKGLLVPLFYKGGGGRGRSKCIPPQKILNFKALKMQFSAFWMRGQQTCTLTIYFNM